MGYNWINEDSFGSGLPDTWEEDAICINNLLEEAGIPEKGVLTPEQQETVCTIWEKYCSGSI